MLTTTWRHRCHRHWGRGKGRAHPASSCSRAWCHLVGGGEGIHDDNDDVGSSSSSSGEWEGEGEGPPHEQLLAAVFPFDVAGYAGGLDAAGVGVRGGNRFVVVVVHSSFRSRRRHHPFVVPFPSSSSLSSWSPRYVRGGCLTILLLLVVSCRRPLPPRCSPFPFREQLLAAVVGGAVGGAVGVTV
jgi:hypothetical protein